MKLSRFCAKCGKSIQSNDTIYEGFLCEECYIQIHNVLTIPQVISLRQCTMCGAFSLTSGDQEFPWIHCPQTEEIVDFLTRILYEFIFFKWEKKTQVRYKLFLPTQIQIVPNSDLILLIRANPSGTSVDLQKEITIRIKGRHCEHCSNRIGGRYDAIIQIRIQSEQDSPRLAEIMAFVNSYDSNQQLKNAGNYISKTETTQNGYDLKVSNNIVLKNLTVELRSRYHFQIKLSKTLIGVDSSTGSQLFRHSILLKLVPVQKGEYLQLENKIYFVKNFMKNKIILQDAVSSKNVHLPFSIFEKNKYQIYSTNPLKMTEIQKE
jgi:NMD protein affecting ribosome stability and mRNA decay